MFDWGQAVVIAEGTLEGLKVLVLQRTANGHYLVTLEGQNGQILARFPGHLLRAN